MANLYVTTVRTRTTAAATTAASILARLGSGWTLTASWLDAAWQDSATWEKTSLAGSLDELRAADAVVVLETATSRGTLWADLGFALALRIPVYVLADWQRPYTGHPYHVLLPGASVHTTEAALVAAILEDAT